MENEITRLDRLLSRIQLVDVPYTAEGKELYEEICELALRDKLYLRIWSEPILNQLEQLFQTERPDEALFETDLENIRKRTREVKKINEFFFGIIDSNTRGRQWGQTYHSLHS